MKPVLFLGGPLHGRLLPVADGATRYYTVDTAVEDSCDSRGAEARWPPLVGYRVRGGRGVVEGVGEAEAAGLLAGLAGAGLA